MDEQILYENPYQTVAIPKSQPQGNTGYCLAVASTQCNSSRTAAAYRTSRSNRTLSVLVHAPGHPPHGHGCCPPRPRVPNGRRIAAGNGRVLEGIHGSLDRAVGLGLGPG